MPFRLKIYDNFHYGEEDEVYYSDDFATYEAALEAAKLIVKKFCADHVMKEANAEKLYNLYTDYGEDPAILAIPPDTIPKNFPHFSAWNYAKELTTKLYKDLKKNSSPSDHTNTLDGDPVSS